MELDSPRPPATAAKPGDSPVYFRSAGQGSPLLLVHGLLVNGRMFDFTVPSFAARHQVIVPDLRGYGRSQRLPGPYTVRQHGADLAALLDMLALDKVDVLGYSQGGAVAQQFAHDYPARVRRLVLGCTYAYNVASFDEKVEAALMPWVLRLLGPRRFMGFGLRASGMAWQLGPSQVRWLENLAAGNKTSLMVEAAKAMATFDSRRWLSSIQAPTLIVAGGADKAVPPRHARILAKGISNSTLRIVPGAGHLLILTHREQFLTLVEDFLGTGMSAEESGV